MPRRASSDVIVDRSAVFDAVEGDLSLFVVNPQEDAIVTDPVFLDSLEVLGWILEGKSQGLGMVAEPLGLFDDPSGDVTVQLLEIGVKLRGRRYSIHRSFFSSLRGRVFPERWLARALRILARDSGLLSSRKSSISSSSCWNARVARESVFSKDSGTAMVLDISKPSLEIECFHPNLRHRLSSKGIP